MRGLLKAPMGLPEQSLMITPMQEFLPLSKVASSTLTLKKSLGGGGVSIYGGE